MILSAQTIRRRNQNLKLSGRHLFEPFNERTRSHGMTYGLGPAGYDVRIEFDEHGLIEEHVMRPGEQLLASTIEHFDVPNDLLAKVHDKSTWARHFLFVQNTVIEPGWSGYLTVEITNDGLEDIVLKRGMPIGQIVFHQLDQASELAYNRDEDRGKYMNQRRGPVRAIMENSDGTKTEKDHIYTASWWSTIRAGRV